MIRKINFKALIWNLVPLWTFLVAGMWLHLEQIQMYPNVLFSDAMIVSGLNSANQSMNASSCQGLTPCWNTMCRLAGISNVSSIGLQSSTTPLKSCNSNLLTLLNHPHIILASTSSLLVMLAFFAELINLAIAAIATGFTAPIFNWFRYVVTVGSMLLMEAAIIVMISQIQLKSIQSMAMTNWSLGLDGMMMATIAMSSIGATIARLSVSNPSSDKDSLSEYDILSN